MPACSGIASLNRNSPALETQSIDAHLKILLHAQCWFFGTLTNRKKEPEGHG